MSNCIRLDRASKGGIGWGVIFVGGALRIDALRSVNLTMNVRLIRYFNLKDLFIYFNYSIYTSNL